MEQDLQLWSDMLIFTGWSLNQQKCSYHITYYGFKDSGEPYLNYPPVEQPIQVQEDGVNHVIKYLPHISEVKKLGVLKCPEGTYKNMVKTHYEIKQQLQ